MWALKQLGIFMTRRTVALLTLILAALLILLLPTYLNGPKKVELQEIPVAWPQENISSRLCSSGSGRVRMEAVVISCDAECYYLLRYWVLFPADVEVRSEVPVEISMGNEILLRRNVTFYKLLMSRYVHTPILIVKAPEGSDVSVGNFSFRVPGCSKNRPRPPQVVYTLGLFRDWEFPFKGLGYVHLIGDVYAVQWNGTAKLSCGQQSMALRDLGKKEVALISVGKRGCYIEVGGKRAHLPGD